MSEIYEDIKTERKRQDEKWGEQQHWFGDWMTILGEEYGEACKEVCSIDMQGQRDRLPNLRKELVEVAAVAVQIIEKIDKLQTTPDGGNDE